MKDATARTGGGKDESGQEEEREGEIEMELRGDGRKEL